MTKMQLLEYGSNTRQSIQKQKRKLKTKVLHVTLKIIPKNLKINRQLRPKKNQDKKDVLAENYTGTQQLQNIECHVTVCDGKAFKVAVKFIKIINTSTEDETDKADLTKNTNEESNKAKELL